MFEPDSVTGVTGLRLKTGYVSGHDFNRAVKMCPRIAPLGAAVITLSRCGGLHDLKLKPYS